MTADAVNTALEKAAQRAARVAAADAGQGGEVQETTKKPVSDRKQAQLEKAKEASRREIYLISNQFIVQFLPQVCQAKSSGVQCGSQGDSEVGKGSRVSFRSETIGSGECEIYPSRL